MVNYDQPPFLYNLLFFLELIIASSFSFPWFSVNLSRFSSNFPTCLNTACYDFKQILIPFYFLLLSLRIFTPEALCSNVPMLLVALSAGFMTSWGFSSLISNFGSLLSWIIDLIS